MAWRRLLLLLLLLLAAAIVAPSFVIVPAATTATACPFSQLDQISPCLPAAAAGIRLALGKLGGI
jgi:hypothetical protein